MLLLWFKVFFLFTLPHSQDSRYPFLYDLVDSIFHRLPMSTTLLLGSIRESLADVYVMRILFSMKEKYVLVLDRQTN
jgi:hypothetical protein